MLRLKRRQREILIEKLPDVTDRVFSIPVAMAGVAVWTLLWVLTLVLAEEKR
jgi:hypothetical protein